MINYIRKFDKCEICGNDDKTVIHKHHILPRYFKLSTDTKDNLVALCANCHTLIHSGKIILEGIYYTTAGFKVFWHYLNEKHTIRPGIILHKNGKVDILEE